MKKLNITLCLLAAAFSTLMAGPVDQQKAEKIGTKFLSTTTLNQRNSDIQLQLVSTATNRGAVDYYVFNVSNGEGFVVIAGDDRVRPILAYSTTGKYNPDDVADGFRFTLDGFREEIQFVREHNLKATPDIVAEWKHVSEAGSINRGGQTRAVVGPLCQTLWHQNYPWNSECPVSLPDTLNNGGHAFAGCVATAMGQVMKYWEWPAVGNGSHSYTPEGFDPQSANFGETEYHFEKMPLNIDSYSSEEEIHYVAQLLHHIGISVEMIYGGNGSGAYSIYIPSAYRDYFRYSTDAIIFNFGDLYPAWGYTNEEWAQMLKDGGLDEHVPIVYNGSDDNDAGGHAFVCDGYDENDYFHFNWGWNGHDNAWCPIGALHTTRYDFNQGNSFVGHIVPQSEEYFSRPDSVANMQTAELSNFDGVRLSWTNPNTNLNGNALNNISTITVRRNFDVIATLTDIQPGASMEYVDNGLAPGLYEYSIYVTNEAGISRTTYRTILVGEKCDIIFQLHDTGGDGWKGAAIKVTDENDNPIALVSLEEGSEKTVTLPLLKAQLNFAWVPGWYHDFEQYDTDSECSYTILDSQGEELFTSAIHSPGLFMSYQNKCDQSVEENESPIALVFPNPTYGQLHIEGEGTLCVSVSNQLGQTIMETSVENSAILDLSRFGTGMYFVRIETEKGTTVQKVNLIK